MKKVLYLFILTMLFGIAGCGWAEESPIYKAYSAIDFHMRDDIEAESRIIYIPAGKRVQVYEYKDGWCRIQYDKKMGWCRARWLNSYTYTGEVPETQYKAYTASKIQTFLYPDELCSVIWIEDGTQVDVYEIQGAWSRIGWDKKIIWCKTSKLWGFRSLNAARYPVPGVEKDLGILTLSEDAWISSEDFDGVTAKAGALICVSSSDEEKYTLPVWRSESTLPLNCGTLLPFVSWEEAQHGDLIGGFTTFYDLDYGGKLADARAFNVNLGCERLDRLVIAPGEEFSFNAVCGPYRKNNGYVLAPNISKDGTGYGGGVCQVTTTLYNAILPLPLQIEAWAVHQRSGVPYIPQYFDAAVGTRPNLVFINTLPYPITLYAADQQGVVTILIFRSEAVATE